MSGSVARAADFISTLGVNTHIPYTDGGYASVGNILADLRYLGISYVRDGISDGYAGSAPISSYTTLAQQGIQFTFCLFTGGNQSAATIASQLALVDQVARSAPGAVTAVEGANEINNWPVTYNGVGGLQGAVDLQKAIYAAVKADPALSGVAVDYFTGYGMGGLDNGPNPTTTARLADYNTQHPYPNQGDPPYVWVNRTQALNNESPASGPAVYTETGYSTNGGTNGAVNEDVQARYTLDLLMDDAKSGIAHTYLYQLMDAYQPGSPQGDDGYGLFDPNNQPKAAATAIHNLTTILADSGSNASTFTTTASVAFSIANLPNSNDSYVIQKSNGATDLVVWNEPKLWDDSTGTELTASSTNVTVSLGKTYQTVKVFDPLVSSSAVKTYSNVSSVSLGVTDHPLIVEVEPQTTAGSGTTGSGTTGGSTTGGATATTHTITLNMSEAYWQGDAQFTVSVDGKQVGGVNSVAALHDSGDSSVFTLSGDWGSGSHAVAVSFINDAYGGTAATDRNLFIDSIAYDGVTQTARGTALFRDGTATATVGSGVAAQSGPADQLSVHLSEDAWNGDAQFYLTLDGKQLNAPQMVTALKSAGAWEDFAFSGSFGAGTHTLGITFTNDSYGGTTSTDRNLYVNGVTVNGQNYGTGVVSMMSSGTTTYSFTTSH